MQAHVKNQFKFCPFCGEKDSFIFDNVKIFRCKNCKRSYFINPASAVGAIIETPSGILFVKRKYEPKKDFLDLPGGFAELHEKAEDAIIRELKEEIHFHPDNLTFFSTDVNDYIYENVLYTTLDIYFYKKIDYIPNTKSGDDAKEILFIKKEHIDFDLLAFNSSVNVLKRYMETFK